MSRQHDYWVVIPPSGLGNFPEVGRYGYYNGSEEAESCAKVSASGEFPSTGFPLRNHASGRWVRRSRHLVVASGEYGNELREGWRSVDVIPTYGKIAHQAKTLGHPQLGGELNI